MAERVDANPLIVGSVVGIIIVSGGVVTDILLTSL
jgi:hypothetical protein